MAEDKIVWDYMEGVGQGVTVLGPHQEVVRVQPEILCRVKYVVDQYVQTSACELAVRLLILYDDGETLWPEHDFVRGNADDLLHYLETEPNKVTEEFISLLIGNGWQKVK